MNGVHIDNNFTGRTQDNTMCMSSALHFAIDGDDSFLRRGGFIIADEGFACREHILRPYNKRTDDLEKILFNFVIKSTRLLVENAIGVWKQKCPLLNIGMHKMEPEDLTKTILASAVLYQLWKMTNEKVMNVDTKMYTDKAKYIPSRFIGKRGVNLRDEVKRFLCDHNQEALSILSTLHSAGAHANAELTCLIQQSLSHHTLSTLPLEAGDGDGTEGVSSPAF